MIPNPAAINPIRTPCWIITLNPASDEVQQLLFELTEQGVDAQAVPGVDGRHGMPALAAGERLAFTAMRWRHLCDMNPTEVGCYLAHLRALRRAYDAGLARVCILEDDVQLEPAFLAVLGELEQLPGDVEMIRLMGLKIRKRKIVRTLADGVHQLVRPERGTLGTQGYLVNRAGMKKILDYGSDIFEPIDKLYDHFWEYGLRVYGVEPHLLWETDSASSIQKSNVAKTKVAAWWYWVYPLGKLWRSITRHYFLLKHRREFYPAEKPAGASGRTRRIKF